MPASRFPERAGIYVCDGCGADVTRYLHPRPAHVRAPYGPERHFCQCGRVYATGAVEWDSLAPPEKRRRIVGLILGICAGFLSGFICYLFLTTGMGLKVGILVSVAAAVAFPARDGVNILRSIARSHEIRHTSSDFKKLM